MRPAVPGQGWGFGLHEALDQTGATIGPLLVAFILWQADGYRTGFALLLFPACIAMALVVAAARQYPRPRDLAPLTRPILDTGLAPTFWLYCLAGALIGAGYADFALVAYHFGQAAVIAPAWIPVFYAIAMLAAGGAALVLGRLLDRYGIVVVLGASVVAAIATPLVFLGGIRQRSGRRRALGRRHGSAGSVLKAALGTFVPPERRATGYGTYDMLRGVAWFLGSMLLGFLYDRSIPAVVVASLALQLLATPVLLVVLRRHGRRAPASPFAPTPRPGGETGS